jgi:hypothetical protein
MAADKTAVLEANTAQRDNQRRVTFDLLLNKPRARQEISFRLKPGEEPYTVLLVAISGPEYEEIVTKHPPTQAQRAEGGTYDPDRFAPELLSKVCAEPALSVAQWAQIWKSPDWSRGEVGDLFFAAVGLCNRGLDVGPTGTG